MFLLVQKAAILKAVLNNCIKILESVFFFVSPGQTWSHGISAINIIRTKLLQSFEEEHFDENVKLMVQFYPNDIFEYKHFEIFGV